MGQRSGRHGLKLFNRTDADCAGRSVSAWQYYRLVGRDAGGTWAVDLYAGAGLFSLPLSRRFSRVTAVESGSSSVRDLRFNIEQAGASVDVAQSTTEDFLGGLKATPDFVLADPPRTGLGRAVVMRLSEIKPERITIVAPADAPGPPRAHRLAACPPSRSS